MAGWGHKHLADLGRSLRPYLNPSAVEEEKSKSSRYTKPAWQRELEQTAALTATEAKRQRGDLSIRRTELANQALDRKEAVRGAIDEAQMVRPDEVKGDLASSLADAQGRSRFPTMGRGGHLESMPASYKEAQAVTYLDKGTDTKEGDILTKALSGDIATDYQAEKDKLARAVIKDETALLRQQGVIDANQIRLEKAAAAETKRNLQAKQAAEDREAKIAARVLKAKHDEEKAALLANEKDRKRDAAVAREQRRISLANLKLARQRQERRDKVEADAAKAEAAAAKALATAEAKEQKAFDTKVEKRIAAIMKKHPTSRQDLKVGVQDTMAGQMYGAEGAGGSLRAGFDATQTPVADEDWTQMLSPQERTVILDQLWRHAVDRANSRGTSAQNEFNMLSLAISQGKISPYDFLEVTTVDPNAPTTRRPELKWPASASTLGGFLFDSKLGDFGIGGERETIPMDERETITRPDLQVRSEGDLLAALQRGDTLGNYVYQVDGVGAFQWDNATQKFVKLY